MPELPEAPTPLVPLAVPLELGLAVVEPELLLACRPPEEVPALVVSPRPPVELEALLPPLLEAVVVEASLPPWPPSRGGWRVSSPEAPEQAAVARSARTARV